MKFFKTKLNKGMTAVELIIVIGIFSVMASTVTFNYGRFQSKVDIKNLANEIALKVVEAQKAALSGRLQSGTGTTWKPAYGVLFSTSAPTRFAYFVDTNGSGTCTGASQCNPPFAVGGEVLEVITITKGNSIPISGLEIVGSGCPATVSSLTILFKRPDTSPIFTFSPSCSPSNVAINVSSPLSLTAKIKIFSSGQVQIN